MDTHPNIKNNIDRYSSLYSFSPSDRMVVLQSFSFSGVISTIFGALLNGSLLWVYDFAKFGAAALMKLVEAEGITILHAVPRILVRVFQYKSDAPCNLRLLRVEGDICRKKDALFMRKKVPNAAIYCGYGCTECGLVASFRVGDSEKDFPPGLEVPVGVPVGETVLSICDEDGKEVRDGETGYVWMFSRFISPGYDQNPTANAKHFRIGRLGRAFVPGDLGYFYKDEDGKRNLVLIGRADSVGKILGKWVPTTQIERILQSLDQVQFAFTRMAGERGLFAYLLPKTPSLLSQYDSNKDLPVVAQEMHIALLNENISMVFLPIKYFWVRELRHTNMLKLDKRTTSNEDNIVEIPFWTPQLDEKATTSETQHELFGFFDRIWQETLGTDRHYDLNSNFFYEGGDSIAFQSILFAVLEKYSVQLPTKTLLACPTLGMFVYITDCELSSRSDESKEEEGDEISSIVFKATETQNGIAIACRTEEQLYGSYLMHFAITLPNETNDLESFSRLLGRELGANNCFRSMFKIQKEEVVVEWCSQNEWEENLKTKLSIVDRVSGRGSFMEKAVSSIEVGEPCMFYVELSATGEEIVLQFAIHHLIMDGLSLWNFAQKVLQGLHTNTVSLQKEGSIFYRNYEKNRLRVAQHVQSYYSLGGLRMIDDSSPKLLLKLKHIHSQLAQCEPHRICSSQKESTDDTAGLQVFPASTFIGYLEPHLVADVKKFCQSASATTYSFLLCCFQLMLRRLFTDKNFAIATPVSLKGLLGASKDDLGCYVETCFVPFTSYATDSFVTHLLQTQNFLSLFSYAEDIMAQKMLCKTFPDLRLLTEMASLIMFVHEDNSLSKDTLGNAFHRHHQATTFCDIAFSTTMESSNDGGQRIRIELEYNTDAIHEKMASSIVEAYTNLVRSVATYGETIPILASRASLDLLRVRMDSISENNIKCPESSQAVRQLRENVTGEISKPPTMLTHSAFDFFKDSWTKYPENPAIVWVDESDQEHELSYTSLSYAVSVLQDALLSVLKSDSPGSPLTLCSEHDIFCLLSLSSPIHQSIAILAVLSIGAAFVPTDCSRAQVITTEVNASVWVVDEKFEMQQMSESINVINMDTLGLGLSKLASLCQPIPPLREMEIPMQAAAYVIFTSGSTGKPKGVIIEHMNLASLIEQEVELYGLEQGRARVIDIFSYHFDAYIEQMFLAFANGGALVIPDDKNDLYTRTFLTEFIDHHSVDTITTTPVVLQMLRRGDVAGLSTIICGGEALLQTVVEELKSDGRKVFNTYGPTETTIIVTAIEGAQMNIGELSPDVASIGVPLSHTVAVVLDSACQPLPPFLPGHLWITGSGLSRGYMHLSGGERKRSPIFSPVLKICDYSMPWYNTGDLVYTGSEGEFHFKGRSDDQYKVRGFRITTGEVTSAIQKMPGILQSCALVGGEPKRLYGVYTCKKASISQDEVMDHLRNCLPKWSLPKEVVQFQELPLTISGKVDMPQVWKELLEKKKLEKRNGALKTDLIDEGRLTAVDKTLLRSFLALLRDEIGRENITNSTSIASLSMDSIFIAFLLEKLYRTFGVKIKFASFAKCRTVEDLAALLDKPKSTPTDVQMSLSNKDSSGPSLDSWAAVSREQEWFWSLDMISKGENLQSSVICTDCVLISGELDVRVLGKACQAVYERHPILRTKFKIDNNNNGVQILQQPCSVSERPLRINMVNCDNIDLNNTLQQQLQLVPWDLNSGVLFSVSILKVDNDSNRHYLGLLAHHIVVDEQSLDTLIREVLGVYRDLLHGHATPAPSRDPLYYDYIQEQRNSDSQVRVEESLAFWKECLAGAPLESTFPSQKKRTSTSERSCFMMKERLSEESFKAITKLSETLEVSQFTVCFCAYVVILCRFSGQWDVVVGTPVSTRPSSYQNTVGSFVNTLPVRVSLASEFSWIDAIHAVRTVLFTARDHLTPSIGDILREVAPNENSFSETMFQTLFTMESEYLPFRESEGSIEVHRCALNASQETIFDVLFEVSKDIVTLRCSTRFPENLMKAMFRSFDCLLKNVGNDFGAVGLSKIRLCSEEKGSSILNWRNPGIEGTHSSREVTLLSDVVDYWALREPHKSAVICDDKHMSYARLQEAGEALGQRLTDKLGPSSHASGDIEPWEVPKAPILLLLPKSFFQPIGVLGILYSGCPFVVCEVDSPSSRVAYIIKKTSASGIVTLTKFKEFLDGVHEELTKKMNGSYEIPVFFIDDLAEKNRSPRRQERPSKQPISHPSDLAYILFTSGSTGKPKGVMISHESALNTCKDFNGRFNVGWGYENRPLNVSKLGFDLSIYDYFGCWESGGAVVLPSGDTYQPHTWIDLIDNHRVSVWNSVPSLAKLLYIQWKRQQNRSPLHSVRVVYLSGDWIPLNLPRKLQQLFPNAQIYSGGGATEVSIWSVFYPITSVPDYWTSIPYGRPLGNQMIFILDDSLHPCPIGVPGDIYYAGKGVGRGYANNKPKTEEAFIIHPLTNERLYRAGDRGRVHPDGQIEFLGRLDFQRKLNGLRMEMGEVESVILRHKSVEDCCCEIMMHDDGVEYLVAYVILSRSIASPLSEEEIKHSCEKNLLSYMVPQVVIFLESLPLTANGKVDRKKLPNPRELTQEGEKINSTHADSAPLLPIDDGLIENPTSIEESVLNIFRSNLSQSRVTPTTPLSTLRIPSLLVILIASDLSTTFDIHFLPRDLLSSKNIKEVAAVVSGLRENSEDSPPETVCGGPSANDLHDSKIVDALGIQEPTRREASTLKVARCSSMQKLMLTMTSIAEDKRSYVITRVLKASPALTDSVFVLGVCYLLKKYGMLRTQFKLLENGQWCQQMLSFEEVMENPRFLHLYEGVKRAALEEVANEITDLCDINNVVHFAFVRAEEEPHETFVVLSLHHAIADEQSIDILQEELDAMISPNCVITKSSKLLPLPVTTSHHMLLPMIQGMKLPLASGPSFFEFCEEQFGEKAMRKAEESLAFWKKELNGCSLLLDSPYFEDAIERDPTSPREGRTLQFNLSLRAQQNARRLMEETHCSEFVFFLSTFLILLYRVGGERNIVTSFASSTRTPEMKDTIGCFVNTLPLCFKHLPDVIASFGEFCQTVTHKMFDAVQHGDLPLQHILSSVSGNLDAKSLGEPVTPREYIQTMFLFVPQRRYDEGDQRQEEKAILGDITNEVSEMNSAKLPLTLAQCGLASFDIEYDTLAVTTANARMIGSIYQTLLETMDAGTSIREMPIISGESQEQILRMSQFPQSNEATNDPSILLQCIKERSRISPETIAVTEGSRQFSYRELWTMSNKVAQKLRSHPFERNDYVMIMLPRSFEYLFTFFGILLAKQVVIPFDINASPKYLQQVLRSTNAGVLVCSPETWNRYSGQLGIHQPHHLDIGTFAITDASEGDPELELPRGGDPAYCLFTSGSTGTPKGVEIHHRALNVYLSHALNEYVLVHEKKVNKGRCAAPFFSSCTFDFTLTSMMVPLLCGGMVDVISEDPEDLLKFWKEALYRNYAFIKFTPGQLPLLSVNRGEKEKESVNIKCLVIGGEELRPEYLMRIEGGLLGEDTVAIYNEYGPTEATVGCIVHKLTLYGPEKELTTASLSTIPIGVPISQTFALVLSKSLQLVPIGMEGDLYLGGNNVFQSYIGGSDLNRDVFIEYQGHRMYRSGDRAKWNQNGVLEYLGRSDSVVKVAGYRIDLKAVETVICRCQGVESCFPFADPSRTEKSAFRLFCAVIPERAGLDDSALLEVVSLALQTLPSFMRPSHLFVMNGPLPLNKNGKIDVKQLIKWQEGKEQPHASNTSPSLQYADHTETDEITEAVFELWNQVLNITKCSKDDDWYALGGDSMSWLIFISKLKSCLSKKFGMTPKGHEFSGVRTVSLLIDRLKSASVIPKKRVQSSRQLKEGLPLAERNMEQYLTPMTIWFFQQQWWDRSQYIQYTELDPKSTSPLVSADCAPNYENAWAKVVEAHPELRRSYSAHFPSSSSSDRMKKFPVLCTTAPMSKACYRMNVVTLSEVPHLLPSFRTNYHVSDSSVWVDKLDIRLESGCLSGLVLFVQGDKIKRVLIIVHHLAADAMSWNVYLRTFRNALLASTKKIKEDNEENRPLSCVRKMDSSWLLWEAFAHDSVRMREETAYWSPIISKWEDSGKHFLKHNGTDPQDNFSSLEKSRFTIPLEKCVKVLAAGRSIGVPDSDTILGVVLLSMKKLLHLPQISLFLESYGRPRLFSDVEPSEYGGWHTSVFPFTFKIDDKENLSSMLLRLALARQQIPDLGVGFGVLKYLMQDPNFRDIHSHFWFNFLGTERESNDVNDEQLFKKPDMDTLTGLAAVNPKGRWNQAVHMNAWINEATFTIEVEIVHCPLTSDLNKIARFETTMTSVCQQLSEEFFPAAISDLSNGISGIPLPLLTPLQEWSSLCTQRDKKAYWINHIYSLTIQEGSIDTGLNRVVPLLNESLETLILKTPILRAKVGEVGGKMCCFISTDLPTPLDVYCIESEAELKDFIKKTEFHRGVKKLPFPKWEDPCTLAFPSEEIYEPEKWVAWKLALFVCPNSKKIYLLSSTHHALSDGMTTALLRNQLEQVMEAALKSDPSSTNAHAATPVLYNRSGDNLRRLKSKFYQSCGQIGQMYVSSLVDRKASGPAALNYYQRVVPSTYSSSGVPLSGGTGVDPSCSMLLDCPMWSSILAVAKQWKVSPSVVLLAGWGKTIHFLRVKNKASNPDTVVFYNYYSGRELYSNSLCWPTTTILPIVLDFSTPFDGSPLCSVIMDQMEQNKRYGHLSDNKLWSELQVESSCAIENFEFGIENTTPSTEPQSIVDLSLVFNNEPQPCPLNLVVFPKGETIEVIIQHHDRDDWSIPCSEVLSMFQESLRILVESAE